MTRTLDQLRSVVELNMDRTHYEIYLRLIEPNIKSILDDYLKGWQNIESTINRIFFRIGGAYRTDSDFLLAQGDKIKDYEEYIDIRIYKKLRRVRFYGKIQYLHERGILSKPVFELLKFLNRRRNRIHEFGTAFSEIERQGFSIADSVLMSIYIVNLSNSGLDENQKKLMLSNTETQSLQLLNELKKILSTRKPWE